MTAQERSKDKRLRRVYGITLAEYLRLLKYQKGVCYVCRRPPVRYALAVDHEHVKNDKRFQGKECRNRVRGLLCWACNKLIAKARDNAERLHRAAEYLQNPPARKILK